MAKQPTREAARSQRAPDEGAKPPPVELEAVWASYDGSDAKPGSAAAPCYRLADLAATLEAGQLCAVLGPNGAGKSTLVRVIAGTLAPTRGRVLLYGEDAATLDRAAMARKIAVVPQRSEVALGFSVREVVAMGRAPLQGAWQRSTAADERAVDRALEIGELDDLADRPVSSLSGGEQKRVHIARALAQQAPILLLDEAAAHLDVRHAIAMYELIRSEVIASNIACLAVMHDLDAAAQYADRVLLLKDGRLVAEGSVDEVMSARELERAFDVSIHAGQVEGEGPAAGRRYFLPVAVPPDGAAATED
ncbi:MAG: ABC transporter ATP-binding protein [Deltaproteobacteria bacterium]|jgi:iron complex transport system ATP-binding protein|nr:ABC transporter ATP-binding protein [Deltaproteobacteria bacterium]MBW2535949.1 ABC transporter ATP-binding protein [Deltaproteobacteria bacterium]